MKFRNTSTKKELELNITPLIDIVFLLLIFFMVSTNFNKITQISLMLPKVSKEFKSDLIETINLKVTSEGNYFINDRPVVNNSKRTLMSAIKEISKSNTDLPFVIMGDEKAPHQAIVVALDAAGELGFDKIRIAAIQAA